MMMIRHAGAGVLDSPALWGRPSFFVACQLLTGSSQFRAFHRRRVEATPPGGSLKREMDDPIYLIENSLK
jgi:hypothetical protein